MELIIAFVLFLAIVVAWLLLPAGGTGMPAVKETVSAPPSAAPTSA